MSDTEEVGPVIEPPAPLVEDTDTKSIRVAVVHPPLPEPVTVASALENDPVTLMPRRERWWRRAARSLRW